MERNPRSKHALFHGSGVRHRARRRAALALLAVLVTGQACYAYHQTELPAVAPGSEIRLELDDEGPGAARGMSGALFGPRRLEGRLASLDEDSVIVSVWIGEAYAGTPFAAAYQDVMIPRENVVKVEDRQLDKSRTALTALAGVAVIAFLIDSIGFVEIFGHGGKSDEPTPPKEFGG